MTSLVTGGAGFIGSHLCERLLARGERVLALDDLSTGTRANLARCLAHPRFELVVGSVLDEALVRDQVSRAEGVFHLAALVGVRLVLERPSATLETNALGTRHVLAAAADSGARVLFASSSEVYGRSERLPSHEDDPLLLGAAGGPRWSYACSKALGERMALARARENALPVLVVRFFNVVGPRQRGDFGMVLPRFVRAACGGEHLTVYGDGAQTRCFLHVSDALDALLALWDEPRARGQVVNVGSRQEVSILELAWAVREAAASRSPIARMPYREAYGMESGDLPRRLPDTARLRELTGCAPRIGLDEVIRELVELERSAPTESRAR